MKYKILLLLLFALTYPSIHCQEGQQEYRIKSDNFPKIALTKIASYLEDARREKFYKLYDGEKVTYEARFKKDRLFYNVGFDSLGMLKEVKFVVEIDDIPEESFEKISTYIESTFQKPRIKNIQQQYPINHGDEKTTLKEAFQNLILPHIQYELIVYNRGENGLEEYELLFDANGNLLDSRKSVF